MHYVRFKSLFALLLIALLFFKVSGAHVYTHQDAGPDQIENCKICDSAIENQQEAFLPVNPIALPKVGPDFFEEKNTPEFSDQFSNTDLHFWFFGRPPPSLG